MFTTDAEIRQHALQLWANHIETRDVNFSAADRLPPGVKVQRLDDDQTVLVRRIRSLAAAEGARS